MKKLLYAIIAILLILATLCSCGEDDDLSDEVAAYRAEKMARYESENEQYADYEVDVAFLGDSRTVDVHIKRLREKLKGVSAKWSLSTVWGIGYKFELK